MFAPGAGFLPVTQPNFYQVRPKPATSQVYDTKQDMPIPDSRYPGLAAIAEDARFGTDYRPQCSRNIPVGAQFATRQWMQHNAEKIIQVSRERMSDASGAGYTRANTVPPAAYEVSCGVQGCQRRAVAGEQGVGDERADAPAPHLFGTFMIHPTSQDNRKNIAINRKYEGGRNTPAAVRDTYDSERIAGRLTVDG